MIKEYFRLGLKNLKHRKIRSWLTILGIVIGIATIVLLITLTNGMENAIEQEFSKLGATTIRVTAKGMRGPPTNADIITQKDVDTIDKIIGIEYISPMLMKNAKVEFNNKEVFTLVAGYPTKNAEKGFKDLNFEFKEGEAFSKEDSDVILIGNKIAEDYFNKEVKLRNTLTINKKKFKVMGIFEPTGVQLNDEGIYTPLESARDIFEDPEGVSLIMVKVLEGIDVKDIQDKIQRKLKRSRGNENFEVVTPEQIIGQINNILGIIQFILIAIAAISLIVGAIGIMNSMYTSVLERTKDIGIMKSIGARNSDILLIFIIEAGMVGLVGGIIGIIIGSVTAIAVEKIVIQLGFTLLKITIDYKLLLFAIGFSFLTGIISGIYPAYRASKLQPIQALRYE